MSLKQTVIYAARTMQHAHLLKNMLAEEGIEAVVVNDLLERGAGVDVVGWATLARVVVAEHDATAARQIALDFDRRDQPRNDDQGPEEPAPPPTPDVLDEWPVCPECDARRLTRCPICETSGTDFPLADADFIDAPQPGPTARAASCSCGSAGCTAAGPAAEDESAAAGQPEAGPPPVMLVCPTCDEPFVPEYPRECEWCGHEFDDGYRVEPPTSPAEELDRRIMAVIIGLLLLAAALVAYFSYIV